MKKFADKSMAQKYAAKYIKDFAANQYSLPTKNEIQDVHFEIFEDDMDRYVAFMPISGLREAD
jgi:hypothetical protein